MSRFSGVDPEGNRVVGLGITLKTFNEMLAGKMMVLNLASLGVPQTRLLVIAGKDQEEIAQRLNHKMNEDTKVILPATSVLRADGK